LDALSGRAKPPSLVNELVADERLRHYIGIIEAAFPKFEIFTEDVLGEEDKIVVRGTLRGIHSGELMGIAPA
jgi:predicted ester cyclase